jgi:hypothetical protein
MENTCAKHVVMTFGYASGNTCGRVDTSRKDLRQVRGNMNIWLRKWKTLAGG